MKLPSLQRSKFGALGYVQVAIRAKAYAWR